MMKDSDSYEPGGAAVEAAEPYSEWVGGMRPTWHPGGSMWARLVLPTVTLATIAEVGLAVRRHRKLARAA